MSVILTWLAFVPPRIPKLTEDSLRVALPRIEADTHLTRELTEFSPLFTRALGGPLYDPPEVVASPVPQDEIEPKDAAPPPKKRKLVRDIEMRVVGTLIESGRSLAILVDSEGRIQLRGEGDALETIAGEAKVARIGLKQVTILVEDDELTLETP